MRKARLTLTTFAILIAFSFQFVSQAAPSVRLGAGIPLTTMIGNENFGVGLGLIGCMDIQSERYSSYFLNIGYMGLSSNDVKRGPIGSEYTVQASISDWNITGGAAYYPLGRKEDATPLLSIEYGFRIVAEDGAATVNTQKIPYKNNLLFQQLGACVGAEVQIDNRLSAQAKARFNLNIPLGEPKYESIIWSSGSPDYLMLQFELNVCYRLGRQKW